MYLTTLEIGPQGWTLYPMQFVGLVGSVVYWSLCNTFLQVGLQVDVPVSSLVSPRTS